MKNKNIAAILALFFGGFGVHKFYLKDPGTGIFYIMLTMFGSSLRLPIGSILGFIDAFVLFTMSQDKFDAKYNAMDNRQGRRTSRRENRRASGRYQTQRGADRHQQYNPKPASRMEPSRRTSSRRDNPFKKSGIKRLEDYELNLAEDELLKAIDISPDDFEIHYALAKLYSLTEKKDKSFYHLAMATQKGMIERKKYLEDPELAFIRIQPEFENFKKGGFLTPPQDANSNKKNNFEESSAEPPITEDLLQDDLLLSQLNRLAELRKKGLLSEQEFQEEKVKLLNK